MKDEMEIEDFEIGQVLKEKQKWLNKREQFYREHGFYKVKGEYIFYKDAKQTVTNITGSSVQVFQEKKTNKGVDCYQWYDLRRLNERFEK